MPPLEPHLTRHEFLRIAELEACIEYIGVIEMPESRQYGPNFGSDGIIPFTMPAQILLGLFSEVVEVRHWRICCHLTQAGIALSTTCRCALRSLRIFPRTSCLCQGWCQNHASAGLRQRMQFMR
jgi:hypothetical protein